MRSGANMDIKAKVMLDDPALSGEISFYHDARGANLRLL